MIDVQSLHINDAWIHALENEFKHTYFAEIFDNLHQKRLAGKVIYPPEELIFAAYNACPPALVKVVILGQDPYHNPGEAMGMSFSVPQHVKIPPSLRIIYKELQNDQHIMMPTIGDLTAWANQGVFLLNAMLTVEHRIPGSHKNIGWQKFTDATISYLSAHCHGIVFMLWGNFAKSKRTLIDTSRHLILESAHPSPLAGNAFQGCKHFSQANTYLIAQGKTGINWQV
jgi:uracil-DNA glycosylase